MLKRKDNRVWHTRKVSVVLRTAVNQKAKFAKAGNIIVRQRGTVHNPGENMGMGSDHTLFALCDGIVTFRKRRDNKSYVSIQPVAAEA